MTDRPVRNRNSLRETIAQAHAMWATSPASSESISRQLAEDGRPRIVDAREVERAFGAAARRAWQLLRSAKREFLAIALAPDPGHAEEELLDRIAAAIEEAGCPGRQGPYGVFDYSRYPGEAPPHVVRDFRDPGAPSFGAVIFRSSDPLEAQAQHDRLMRRHLAEAVLLSLRGETGASDPKHTPLIPGASP